MDERELEVALREAGRSRVRPPTDLVARTKQRVHGTRLLPPLLFASLALHVLVLGVGAVVLWALDIRWPWLIAIGAGLLSLSGSSALLVIAAREWIADFCGALEHAADPAQR